MGGNPEPREYLVKPSEFGKRLDSEWKSGIPLSVLATSEVQHRFSYIVRNSVKRKYGSVQAYCRSTNQDYQRLGRVLRGQTPMRIEDIGRAIEHLHLSVAFLSSDDDGDVQLNLTAAKSSSRDSLGAFYTPYDISRYIVSQLDLERESTVLEPAFGDGSFLRACTACGVETSNIFGCEIDPAAVSQSINSGCINRDNVYCADFFLFSDRNKFDSVVGNPPFVRIRSLKDSDSDAVYNYCRNAGFYLGEESSIWLPFLLKSVQHLNPHGSLGLVLPQDFTYLRYARFAWEYLGKNFSKIRVIRVKERLFKDILQDVILLVAENKGGRTATVSLECFDNIIDLLDGRIQLRGTVYIRDVLNGDRPFQKSLIDGGLLDEINRCGLFIRAEDEASFHIGYVCGNKSFFHPDSEVASEFELPESSLRGTAISSRQLGVVGYRTSASDAPGKLWLPNKENLSAGEKRYISIGEATGVSQGYKCRVRKPWWIVPGVSSPSAILSVFGNLPKMIINDGDWTISNSLLGAYCDDETNSEHFASTWYSSVTRLSIELQVHSLGGGVLIAVPQEANKVQKLKCGYFDPAINVAVESAVNAGDTAKAYQAYDRLIADKLGTDFIEAVKEATTTLISWRKH